jgi:hypothetical protein
MAQREDRGATTYDLRLARFYMWAQTAHTVFLACRVPTGAAPAGATRGLHRLPALPLPLPLLKPARSAMLRGPRII